MTRATPLEDADQAAILATTWLPYDERTRRVLHGPHAGQPLAEAEDRERRRLLRTHAHVRTRTVTLRPWWRLWRRTPARMLVPGHETPHLEPALPTLTWGGEG